jgi:hypothetical protein
MKKIFKKNKYLVIAFALLLLALPLILLTTRQRQEIRSSAQASTVLYFSPTSTSSSPLLTKVAQPFYLDLMLNPGQNLVSIVRIEINYDPAKLKLSPADPFVINQTLFPQIMEGPIYTAGKIQAVVSVGSDQTKAINQTSKLVTINFIPISTSKNTSVSVGTPTKIYSVSANDLSNENVLSSTTPAYIKITKVTGKPVK